MEYAVYKGSVVEVLGKHGNFISIKDASEDLAVDKKDLVPIPCDVAEDMVKDLAAIRTKTEDVKSRMYHLEVEYTKKMNALREIYMDIRRDEQSLVNKLLNSHYICQNNTY